MLVRTIKDASQEPAVDGCRLPVPIQIAGVEGVCTIADPRLSECWFDLGDDSAMSLGHVPALIKTGPIVAPGERVRIWMTAKYKLLATAKHKDRAVFWCRLFENLTRGVTHDLGTWAELHAYVPSVWDRLGVDGLHVHDPASEQADGNDDLCR